MVRNYLMFVFTFIFFCGCAQQPVSKLIDYQNENLKLTRENTLLQKNLSDANQTIDTQTRQIENLNRMGSERFAKLTRVKSVQLERLTGGYQDDKHNYDDGIVVYLQPIDPEGNIIKAAGQVRIRLFELQNDPPTLIGECIIKPDQLEKQWISRFWTNHYTLRCPFKKKPKTTHITVQVDFTELLTGKPFVAEKLVEIKIPPKATTQPSK